MPCGEASRVPSCDRLERVPDLRLPLVLIVACGASTTNVVTITPSVETRPRGLHVVGNAIEDANGKLVRLLGVNRSGSEYACAQDIGIFDGPVDDPSIAAIKAWNANAVRIPL